ncbi:MAG: hydantoinase/oxoprolinase family protein, partial [Rubrobacteraceae bacterium]
MTEQRQPVIVTSDAGGTMTDIFAIDEKGEFVVGKAPSTPHDASVGFMASLEDALSAWGHDGNGADAALESTQVAIFSGTMMLNTLLSRAGRRIGLIITRGFEDYSIVERARQTYAGYSYSDRLHGATHQSNPPLVQRHHTRGVTERVDMFGEVVVPLHEDELRSGVEELLAQGVEGIAICFLFSHVNATHEQRAKELAREVLDEAGSDISIYVSHGIAPVMREYSRLNSTLMEAYAADPARWHLERCEEGLHSRGFKTGLLTVIASGGLVPVSHDRLYETIISGPVGGLFGAKHVADKLGLENVITSDLGGTSFDVGLLTAGQLPIIREPEVGNFWLNLPMVELRTIGAGAGSYVKVNELTGRVEIGPESAGADPGPACYGMGSDQPTILDCNVITGIIDPANYLGGQVEIFPDKALDSIRRYVSDPLGIDPYTAAEG